MQVADRVFTVREYEFEFGYVYYVTKLIDNIEFIVKAEDFYGQKLYSVLHAGNLADRKIGKNLTLTEAWDICNENNQLDIL